MSVFSEVYVEGGWDLVAGILYPLTETPLAEVLGHKW